MRSTRTKSGQRVRFSANGKYWFDGRAARAACDFFPRYLRHTKGEWRGRPFVLNRPERRIVRKIFGWKRLDGTRRYRRAWIEIPRKNGKTEFAAGLLLLLLVGDNEPAPELYSLAREEGQARIVFETAAMMVGLSPELRKKVEPFKTALYCAELTGSIKPLTALPQSKQGFNPSGFVGDEVHVWKDGDLAEGVHEGEGARAQPLDILITTAGEIGSYAHEQHEYALAVQRGEIEDDTLLVAIFAANDDDDWTDPKIWAKANPGLGVSPRIDFLQDECRKARNLPRLQNRFRRYYLNQWVEQATRWIPMESWALCTAAPDPRAVKLYLTDADLDPALRAKAQGKGAYDPDLWKKLPALLKGRACAGALDLATTRDLASLCLEFAPLEEGGPLTYLWKFWLPEASLALLGAEEKRRYEKFVAEGALTLTPGNVTDYAYIKRDVLEARKEFDLRILGVDRWNATQLAVELRGEEGVNVELFGQGFVSMSAPSKEFERAFLSLGIEHGNNPVAHWMAKNVAVDTDAHDNIKPVKPGTGATSKSKKAAAKVDGIVAAIMARGVAMAAKPEEPKPVSIYEKLAQRDRERAQSKAA